MEGGSNSMGLGFVAVCAVSGSVVLVARQLYKRLLSDFMKKIECEMHHGSKKRGEKKRVRFAEDVIEPSTNNKEYRNKRLNVNKALQSHNFLAPPPSRKRGTKYKYKDG